MTSYLKFIGRGWVTACAVSALLALSGCGVDVAALVKAASADPSSSCIHINQVITGATSTDITWARSNSQAGSQATGGPNGCTVNHQDVPTAAPQPSATPPAPVPPSAPNPVTAQIWKPVLPPLHAQPVIFNPVH